MRDAHELRMRRLLASFTATLLLGACTGPEASPVVPSPVVTPTTPALLSPSVEPTTNLPTPSETPEPAPTLIAAGDIASCDMEGDSATAAGIAGLEGTVATLGDNVYPAGSDETFPEC